MSCNDKNMQKGRLKEGSGEVIQTAPMPEKIKMDEKKEEVFIIEVFVVGL